MQFGLNNNITPNNNINSANHQVEKQNNKNFDKAMKIYNSYESMKSSNAIQRVKGIAEIAAMAMGGQ